MILRDLQSGQKCLPFSATIGSSPANENPGLHRTRCFFVQLPYWMVRSQDSFRFLHRTSACPMLLPNEILAHKYTPSEPHGEEEEGFFRVGIYQKDECRQTTITARRHSLFIITSPSSLTTLLLPWGSANQSVPPEWNSNEAERLRAIS